MRIAARPFRCSIVSLALVAACQAGTERPTAVAAGRGNAPAAAPAPAADWCGAHGVPESACTRCNAALIPGFQARGDWCAEHGLPESQCTICHPERIDEFRRMAPGGAETGPPGAGGRGRPYAELRVRLATPQTAARAGIETAAVVEALVAQAVSAPVRLGFDETRSSRLSTPVPGTVREVRVTAGAAVRAGDLIVVVASPELAEANARLRQAEAALVVARAALEREERLVARDVSPRKDLLEARRNHEAALAAAESARGVLSALGAASNAEPGGNLLALSAPRPGVVTDVNVAVGQAVQPGQVLIEIHDPRHLWAELDLAEADAPGVRPGDGVEMTFDSLPGREFAARILWLAPRVDPRTRTVRVRAEVRNDDGLLRAGMFGRARLHRDSSPGVVVPGEAVQDGPEGPVAFVQVDPQSYEPRALELGRATADAVEVVSGLRPGERVVTRGSFLLKTELMKGSLGAGCCDAVEQ